MKSSGSAFPKVDSYTNSTKGVWWAEQDRLRLAVTEHLKAVAKAFEN